MTTNPLFPLAMILFGTIHIAGCQAACGKGIDGYGGGGPLWCGGSGSAELDDTAEVPTDLDGDGYGAGEDCDDANASVNPGATEVCGDGEDNDCNIETPDKPITYYADADGDGYGNEATTTESCAVPDGYAAVAGDCDDANASYHPGAEESDCADPNDYNCDGSAGDADKDEDGWAACKECDDSDAAVNPAADEVCDEQDNDCDTLVDEGVEHTYYADADGDNYGDPSRSLEDCDQPSGYADNGADCDDDDATINPAADELCNGVDDDCDGEVDEDDVCDTTPTDEDGDGYSTEEGDCDDDDATINPGETDTCDGVDNDCDGYVDGDGDVGVCDSDGCATAWYGNHSYRFCLASALRTTWPSAEASCEDQGYTLVQIGDAGENTFLATQIAATSSYCWIGASDTDGNGAYVWVDGTPVDYNNWASGEPSSPYGNLHSDGSWKTGGSSNSRYICESAS